MFDQVLAHYVASNYSIDLANSLELLPNPGLNINFNRDIIIKAKKKALEKAKKYYIKIDF